MNMEQTGRSFVDGLNDAARANPVAAGAIGLGVLWMLFGARNLAGVVSPIPNVTRSMVGSAASAARAGMDGVSAGVSAAADTLGSAVDGIRNTVSRGMDQTLSATQSAAGAAVDAGSGMMEGGREFVHQSMSGSFSTRPLSDLQRSLSETLERQPLVLGALGLAIGAGIAAAFPATQIEQSALGEVGAQAKKSIQDAVSGATTMVKERVSDTAKAVMDEAEARGFSVDAAKEQAKDLAQKAASVATEARGAIKS